MADTGLNNYKGVMLCTRPNEGGAAAKQQIEKPFCSRVDPKLNLGVNPVKKEYDFEKPKRVNMVLKRHQDWLEVFKLKMKYKREMDEDNEKEQQEKVKKIKELAAIDRIKSKKMKEEFNQLNNKIMQELDDNAEAKPKQAKLTENNLKRLEQMNKVVDNTDNNNNYYDQQKQNDEQQDNLSDKQVNQESKQTKPILKNTNKKQQKSKPKWAYTQEEIEAEDDLECDDLLDFVDNLNYDKYISDLEVQTMLKSIKNRVEELKQNPNWKKSAKNTLKEKKRQFYEEQQNDQDIESQMSNGEAAKSVASSRTQQSIQELKQKMEDHKAKKNIQWDSSTTQGDGNQITVEDKIAKLVADEILRNHRNFTKIHSNQSIRKLLEKEAGKHLLPNKIDIAQRYDGPNINIIKERTLRKDQVDPNTLPYMHRNPAI